MLNNHGRRILRAFTFFAAIADVPPLRLLGPLRRSEKVVLVRVPFHSLPMILPESNEGLDHRSRSPLDRCSTPCSDDLPRGHVVRFVLAATLDQSVAPASSRSAALRSKHAVWTRTAPAVSVRGVIVPCGYTRNASEHRSAVA